MGEAPVASGVVDERRGVLAGAIAYTTWGLFPLFFHQLHGTGAVEILGHRIVWSFLTVSIVLVWKRRAGGIATLRADRRRAARIALAAVLLATNWLVYVAAVNAGHVVDAALGYFVTPLVSVGIGVLVLKERLRPAQRAAVLLGAIAVVVLTIGYGRVPWIALALAATFGTYGYLKKTIVLDDPFASMAAESAVLLPLTLVGFVGAVVFGGGIVFGAHGPANTLLLMATGPVTAVPLVLFGIAARRIPLTWIGLLQYFTPVGQFLCGVLVFHEDVPPARLVGLVLVWLALVVLAIDAVRRYRAIPARVPVPAEPAAA